MIKTVGEIQQKYTENRVHAEHKEFFQGARQSPPVSVPSRGRILPQLDYSRFAESSSGTAGGVCGKTTER
jgi:hypothetical protein